MINKLVLIADCHRPPKRYVIHIIRNGKTRHYTASSKRTEQVRKLTAPLMYSGGMRTYPAPKSSGYHFRDYVTSAVMSGVKF